MIFSMTRSLAQGKVETRKEDLGNTCSLVEILGMQEIGTITSPLGAQKVREISQGANQYRNSLSS